MRFNQSYIENKAALKQPKNNENNQQKNKFYLDLTKISKDLSSFSKLNPSSPKIHMSKKFPLSSLSDVNVEEGIDTQDSLQSIIDIGKSLNKNYPKAKRQFNIQNYAKPGYRILLRPENEFYYTSGTQARQDIGLGESRY